MSAQVFISHSSKDRKVAGTICLALESRGLDCWIAGRDITPGENFMEAIVPAIRGAKVMVLVFSENANNSDDVKREIVLASQNKVVVIPVRVEDIVPNDAFTYQFATRQWIDLFDDWERQIERLIASINKIVVADASPRAASDDASIHGSDSINPLAGGHPSAPLATASAANVAPVQEVRTSRQELANGGLRDTPGSDNALRHSNQNRDAAPYPASGKRLAIPGGSSSAHKAAAIALAFLSVVVAIIAFSMLAKDAAALWRCIGNGFAGINCGTGGSLQFAVPAIILFLGFTGAAKVWRG